jgi:hypothetical protein
VHLSLFPMHTFYWGDWHLQHTVGPVLGQNISPTGWLRKRGMIFSSHHDAPVAFPDSMRVLDATVTRRARGSGRIVGPQHRVDVITALKAMTIWPAYQHFEEADKGSIEVGKLADFVVLSRDPTQGDPKTIAQIKVVETIKEGKTVYRRGADEARTAALSSGLDREGGNAFARMLAASALYRDMAALPPMMRTPAAAQAMLGTPHDKACLGRFIDAMAAALASGAHTTRA